MTFMSVKVIRSGLSMTRMFLVRLAVIVCLALTPTQMSLASHDDPTVLADADGALDNDTHVNNIYLAMRENWIAAFMMMTEQFVTVMMQQMFIFGTFLDAQQQLEVQRLLQDMKAQAHKDFHTSFQMCQFGTNVKSLASAEQIGRENAKMLDAILASRERLNANQGASGGIALDVTHRIQMFKDIYCDLNENNRVVSPMCDDSAGPVERRTKDIDYPRLVDNAYTLDVNFRDNPTTPEETETEQDIISLGRNLYAGTTFDFISEQVLNETAGQGLFLDTRSVHAIRSVARHSFTKIVGMKSEGDNDAPYQVADFMKKIIEELGVPEGEINDFLGENPSYFAQMEVLTRKIYQSPEFFTNLYDKPANVRRVGVSLQALEIMQDRDRFESALRREMLISLILELKLRKYQEDMNSVIFTAAGVKFSDPEL